MVLALFPEPSRMADHNGEAMVGSGHAMVEPPLDPAWVQLLETVLKLQI